MDKYKNTCYDVKQLDGFVWIESQTNVVNIVIADGAQGLIRIP